ncbi:hypothetical protein GGX14DRAFT_568517 [Mycena pura]|uniref:Uncharacterized protein n=1 Tax=Mycena pura TaxID=153505 RepID=A0AAD6VAX9_9AGAR|nr:hypothetical protein GGX14DRAFT_568517 [Mycena pura]
MTSIQLPRQSGTKITVNDDALTKAGKVAISSAAQSYTLHTQTTTAPRQRTRKTPRPACPAKTSLPLPLRMTDCTTNGGSSSRPPHSSPSSQWVLGLGAFYTRKRRAAAQAAVHERGDLILVAPRKLSQYGWARRGRGGGRDAAGAWVTHAPA